MKIWIVLKIMTQTLVAVGPLPYPNGLVDCQQQIEKFNSIVDTTFKDAKKVTELRKRWPTLKREDVGYECVESNERPKITDKE